MALIAPAYETPRSPLAVQSYGPLVTRWAKRRLDIEHDPWQEYTLSRMLEADSAGDLIAREALVSVARQNGKTVIIRSLCGWMLDEGYKLPAFREWLLMQLAAHDARQARIPYAAIRRDVERFANVDLYGSSARRQGKARARATMLTGIELNGVLVDVASRQAGSTRGISTGLVAFDEVLTQTNHEMYEVLKPSQVAVKNALMLLTSTAGFSDSVLLRQYYDDLVKFATGAVRPDPSFLGLWWMADDDDVGLDWDALAKANPALVTNRLSRGHIESEFRVLPHGSWVRERLNRWSDERVDAPFSLAAWGACRRANPLDPAVIADPPEYVVAVDVTSTWSEGSIVIAAQRSDGLVGVEVHRHLQSRPNFPLTADDFTREVTRLREKVHVTKIVYATSSALAAAMERYGVERAADCIPVSSERNMMACHDFAEAVIAGRVAHDDAHLDAQIGTAQRRPIGKDGSWRWMISGQPITSVVASTFATMYAMKAVAPVQVFV